MEIGKSHPPVNSTCVVFAKSEAGLLRAGRPKEKVVAAYCSAMAYRVLALLEKINVEKELGITGGIAKNQGVVKRLTKKLGIESVEQQCVMKLMTRKQSPSIPRSPMQLEQRSLESLLRKRVANKRLRQSIP